MLDKVREIENGRFDSGNQVREFYLCLLHVLASLGNFALRILTNHTVLVPLLIVSLSQRVGMPRWEER